MLDTSETVYHGELAGPWTGSLVVQIATNLSEGVWTISCANEQEGSERISKGNWERCKETFTFHLDSPEIIVIDIKGPKKRNGGCVHIRIKNQWSTTVYDDIVSV